MLNAYTIPEWKDYELIDTGGFEKLERFGDFILARPEPQAVWQKALSIEKWRSLAHAWFVRGDGSNDEVGNWQMKPGMKDNWTMTFKSDALKFKFKLALTSFKHVGLFPEQANNWMWIYNTVKGLNVPKPKVLNLFAYTGLASLAANAAGADVAHVDSVRQVVNWSRQNMELSNLDHIRWVVEDAMKFVKNEARRGNFYHGIILDPPAYGRGPNKEKWLLDKHIDEMLYHCGQLINPQQPGFLLMNLYSIGFSPLISESLVMGHFPKQTSKEMGELYIEDNAGRKLPLGTFFRMTV